MLRASPLRAASSSAAKIAFAIFVVVALFSYGAPAPLAQSADAENKDRTSSSNACNIETDFFLFYCPGPGQQMRSQLDNGLLIAASATPARKETPDALMRTHGVPGSIDKTYSDYNTSQPEAMAEFRIISLCVAVVPKPLLAG